MHLALVIERLDPASDGGNRAALDVAGELATRGHHLTLITARRSPEAALPGPVDIRVWPHLYVGYPSQLASFSDWAANQVAAAGAQASLSFTPLVPADILHTWNAPLPLAQAHEPPQRVGLIQRVLDSVFEESRLHQKTLRRLEERTLASPALRRVLALDEAAAQAYRTHYPLPPERVQVVPPGVRAPAEPPAERIRIGQRIRHGLGVPPSACAFFFPAWPLRHEVARATFRAFRQAALATKDLVLLAGGEMTFALHHLAVETGAREYLRLVPTAARLEHLYFTADTTLLPVTYHPCSRAVLMSLRLGIPVIAARGDGASAYVQGAGPGRCGRVVDSPLDENALAAAITELADPVERARCQAAAQPLARELALATHVNRLEAILAELQATPPR